MENRLGCTGFADKLTSLSAFKTWRTVREEAGHHTDTTLRLESPGSCSLSSSSLSGIKRKWDDIGRDEGLDCPSLTLGLGRPSTSSDSSRRSSASVCTLSSMKETDEESMDLGLNFQLHLGNESAPISRHSAEAISKASDNGPKVDLQLTLSVGVSESVITSTTPLQVQQQKSFQTSEKVGLKQITNEGSTSSCSRYELTLSVGVSESVITSMTPLQVQQQKSFQTSEKVGLKQVTNEGSTSSCSRYDHHRLQYAYTSEVTSDFPSNKKIIASVDPILSPDLSSIMSSTPNSPIASISGMTLQRDSNTKKCQYLGCTKGARGASGFCIAHGGGRRCQKDGCQKGAEGRTIYCKAHGGGRRCEHLGCTKSAEGRTDYCIAHGGGRRCSHDGCARAARGKSGLCIRHGGGKRCQRENCTRSAEGHTSLCISHGGGKRCQYQECSKGAQGGTMFCKAHGGGKRCTFLGCDKGAEGSTPFCKGHGGGKRCTFQGGCGKSVHGGTQFCVAHGGGKRCAVPDCTKSARGRTDFCVRHGGGKRCKSDGCGKSAQGSTDFCKAHGGGKRCLWGQSESDLGAGGPSCDRFARGKTGLCATHSALVQDQCVHGGALLGSVTQIPISSTRHMSPLQASMVSLPEGRVHGGSLLAMMATNASLGSSYGSRDEGGTSEQGSLFKMVRD